MELIGCCKYCNCCNVLIHIDLVIYLLLSIYERKHVQYSTIDQARNIGHGLVLFRKHFLRYLILQNAPE